MKFHLQNLFLTTALTAGMTLTLASGDVSAALILRSSFSNATGVCQSALPVFDGQIRKRPLALQNEGTEGAFVSCSMTLTAPSATPSPAIGILNLLFDNNDGVEQAVTCTLVSGFSGGANTFITKTVTLPATSKANPITWTSSDNLGTNFEYANVSCFLPPGTGISRTVTFHFEDDGA